MTLSRFNTRLRQGLRVDLARYSSQMLFLASCSSLRCLRAHYITRLQVGFPKLL
ncbi:hypothetical protein L209DRAFT_336318 [Thermothelomyces heterothallicus CBS 203.75]